MRCLIANPAAGAGSVGRSWDTLLPELQSALGPNLEVRRTSRAGDGTTQAMAAIEAGATTIYSLGGDGTHGEVVAGMIASGRRDLTLGVLHAGTGGDFRRMLPPVSPAEGPVGYARRAAGWVGRPIDVGRVVCVGFDGRPIAPRIFLNEVSFGMSGLVTQLANASSKRLGGRLTFLIATVRAMLRYTPATVRVTVDGRDLGTHTISNIAFANGQYAGGGMRFAPSARLDDGVLDVVILREGSLPRLLLSLPKLYDGTILTSPLASHDAGARLEATPTTEHPAWVEADGEPLGTAPLTVEVLPGAIRLLQP